MASLVAFAFEETVTTCEQSDLEDTIRPFYQKVLGLSKSEQLEALTLNRDNHLAYLYKGLRYLPESHRVLDASRPWLCYWELHSLNLLGQELDAKLQHDAVQFLSRCQHPTGGFGGGPGQIPHLASTYAAVCALITVGTDAALASINREAMHAFLLRMKVPAESDAVLGGGFRMHATGEVDIRGTFTALAVAEMLGIKTDDVVADVAPFLERCQTYEGGVGGEPGTEAHGGYTFCGMATHILLNQKSKLDVRKLLRWAVLRQGAAEGGFNGRTNKLVDGCYSFWQGGVFPLISMVLPPLEVASLRALRSAEAACESVQAGQTSDQDADEADECISTAQASELRAAARSDRMFPSSLGFCELTSGGQPWHFRSLSSGTSGGGGDSRGVTAFNTAALQGWLLLCCQVKQGGLRDKPGQARDYYHTCYCLSGLSIAQHSDEGGPWVLGPPSNLVKRTDPVVNVVTENLDRAREFYKVRNLDLSV
mmetsp:Transcript_14818/g.28535  ORF Transcript_14818/g.28535 Transcript_14818/m.28535 type:complete len:481 (+) Transcript_14818:69-1511(+)